MYLIEKFHGHELAVRCSKIMLADLYKMPQSSYSIFVAFKQHGDENILKVQEFIEGNYLENMTIAELSKYATMSERTFIRRFKTATGVTSTDYIQKVRIESAKKLLEQTDNTMLAIMDKVGYNDLGNFRNVFKKQTGISLNEYRKKFSRLIEE